MEVDIYQREKITAGEIPIKECFKLADSDSCFKVVSLSREEAFKPVLREDVVYAVNFATGEMYIFEKAMMVYCINLKVVEVEKKDKPDV